MSEADINSADDVLIFLTADIVAAHVSNTSVSTGELAQVIAEVHKSLAALGRPEPVEEILPEPAVSIRASVKREHLICLEDGKKVKMLKRHLMSEHGLTPAEYRRRWGLPSDYPMVAPGYTEVRRELAKSIGLGRSPQQSRGRRKPA